MDANEFVLKAAEGGPVAPWLDLLAATPLVAGITFSRGSSSRMLKGCKKVKVLIFITGVLEAVREWAGKFEKHSVQQ